MSFHGNPTIECPVCGKVVKVRAIADDWSNAAYPVNHKDAKTKAKCDGQYHDVSDEELLWPMKPKPTPNESRT